MERCKMLIAGYIKCIGIITPKDVQNVCIAYYFSNDFFYVWIHSNKHATHQLKSLNLSTKKIMDFEIIGTNTKIGSRHYYGMYFAPNQHTPKYVTNTYETDNCSKYATNMIFRIGGGTVSNPSGKCDVVIWDMFQLQMLTADTDRTVGFYPLPSLVSGVGSPAVIYFNDTLYIVGGNTMTHHQLSSEIYALDLSKTCTEWKHMTHETKLRQQRYASSLLFIGENKLLIVGGCSGWAQACDTVELYQFGADANCGNTLKSMHYKRAFTKCCKGIGNDDNQVVIGGGLLGGESAQTAEIYDIVKDVWTVYPHKTEKCHRKAAVWLSDLNKNVLYIAGSRYGAHSDLSCIEWIDFREGTKWREVDLHAPSTANYMGIYAEDLIVSYGA